MKKTFTDENTGTSITTETQSSQELTISTKGVHTWSIKEYYKEGSEEEAEAAFQRIIARDAKYAAQYGKPAGG